MAEEYEAFCHAVTEWTHLREQWLVQTKRAMIERWERSILQARLKELEYGLQLQYRRMRGARAQNSDKRSYASRAAVSRRAQRRCAKQRF